MSRRAIWPRVFPYTGALFASRARPPFRTETADDLDDRPACRANPTGLVPRTIRRLVEGLAAIRICCASRGNCCRRDSPKDAAVLAAYCAGYLRSRRDAENDHLSVPVNGRPAPNGLEEPGGREDARAFEVSPADAETRYSAPQAAARAPLRRLVTAMTRIKRRLIAHIEITQRDPVGACISENARASGNSCIHGHRRVSADLSGEVNWMIAAAINVNPRWFWQARQGNWCNRS
jgi:hypothetical protein